jgi:hypothetical protein
MHKFLCCAAFACLIAGCAAHDPAATGSPAVAAAAPACNRRDAPTGSHLVDRHDCSTGQAVSVSAASVDSAMRRSSMGVINSN